MRIKFAFDPNCRFLVTAPRRQPGAQLIQLGRPSEPRQLLPDLSVSCLAVAPNGRIVALATQSWDQPSEVVLVDSGSGRELQRLKSRAEGNAKEIGVTALCFSEHSKQLYVGYTNGRVQCLDVKSGQIANTYRFLGSITVGHVELVGPQDKYVVARGWGDGPEVETRCWKRGGTEPVWTKQGVVSPDAKGVLAARVTADGDLELLSVTNGQPLVKLRGYKGGTLWLETSE